METSAGQRILQLGSELVSANAKIEELTQSALQMHQCIASLKSARDELRATLRTECRIREAEIETLNGLLKASERRANEFESIARQRLSRVQWSPDHRQLKHANDYMAEALHCARMFINGNTTAHKEQILDIIDDAIEKGGQL